MKIIKLDLLNRNNQIHLDLTSSFPYLIPLSRFFQRYWNHQNIYLPCMNPKSLSRNNLLTLKKNPTNYRFTAKSDGERMQYIVWNDGAESYAGFMDRKFNLYCVVEGDMDFRTANQDECILDGEWILPDIISCNTLTNHIQIMHIVEKPKWIGFDVIVFNNIGRIFTGFQQRQDILSSIVLPDNNVSMSVKQWYDMTAIANLVSFTPKGVLVRGYEDSCDGIIIAHIDGKLNNNMAADGIMFKLKIRHTIDVYLWHGIYWCGNGNMVICLSFDNMRRIINENVKQFNPALITMVEWPNEPYIYNISSADEIIENSILVELAFEYDHDHIRLFDVRERTDKKTANDVKTILHTAQNCLDNIQVSDFIS